TRGDIVTVEGGIYGNEIDRKAEKEYLFAAFLEKRNEIHVPFYKQMARKQGKDDIGDTYIEVDMTNQMMYYYKDGELTIETPVVTGNTSLRRGTPTGTNYVYNKQKNRVLRGADYASPVKFWIPVKGAIGIHDASWRGKYGGEIYKTNGSHGCINTPLEEVTKLYDMVEIGTPCVMFY
ncbi:MAG: L,D-transpeptidase, partial [Lachnospiraceae bacterium]|nr:L,D-transpeptidase [Lachnospiraceae bacterium]